MKKAINDMREERTKSGFVFMGEANLANMRAKWADPEWQKKSGAGKTARKSDAGSGRAVYTGGSVSRAVHKKRIVSIIISDFFCVLQPFWFKNR